MARKILRGALILTAILALGLCVLARWVPVSWRQFVWESPDLLVRVSLACPSEPRDCTVALTQYHANAAPSGGLGWERFDRVFSAAHEIHRGPCILARIGHPIDVFKGHQHWELSVRRWALVVLVLLGLSFPLANLIRLRLRRRKRKVRDQCVKCGYNLSGIAESRCPECNEPA